MANVLVIPLNELTWWTTANAFCVGLMLAAMMDIFMNATIMRLKDETIDLQEEIIQEQVFRILDRLSQDVVELTVEKTHGDKPAGSVH